MLVFIFLGISLLSFVGTHFLQRKVLLTKPKNFKFKELVRYTFNGFLRILSDTVNPDQTNVIVSRKDSIPYWVSFLSGVTFLVLFVTKLI